MLRSYADSTLFGESYGQGPVRVVWLHGWGRRAQDFSVAASLLAERGVASVALDLPGFGASPLPFRAGGARYYAELIAPAVAEIAEVPVVLVGHSFGGTVAVVLASERPELVASLVLVGAPLLRRATSSRTPLRYRVWRWLRARGLVSEARLEAARQKYGSSDYQRASGVLRDVLVASVNESYEPELANVRVPVALLWGQHDHEVQLDVAERAAAMMRGDSTLRVIPGIGHLVPLEAPGELADAVEVVLGL